jgi:outer membrane murein-binding lipoprotein Lpp
MKYLIPLLCVLIAAGCASHANPFARVTQRAARPGATTKLDSKMSFNVRDFGAKGDAKSDDTAAFQRAIDAAHADGGGTVFVPRGNYLIASHITVKKFVSLKGIWEAPPAYAQMQGTTLLATNDEHGLQGTPFITLTENNTLAGLVIFYPNQSKEDPKPYPWTVRGAGGDNCTIKDCLFVNPWAAVDFGTNPCGRHLIDGLYMQSLYRGIFIDRCFDVGRINNVHIWPFWTEGLMKWTEQNGTAFILGRTDWEYISNCFCISYKVGYHFVANKDGPGNCVLTTCGSDIGPTAVLVDDTQGHAGVTFVNGQFMAGIEVRPTNHGPVKFTACGFWGVQNVHESHAVLAGKGTTSFENCHFIAWDQKKTHAPAILAKSGALTVTGCDFMDGGKNQITLEKDVESAIIVANRLRGGEKIINNSGGDVQIGLNSKK